MLLGIGIRYALSSRGLGGVFTVKRLGTSLTPVAERHRDSHPCASTVDKKVTETAQILPGVSTVEVITPLHRNSVMFSGSRMKCSPFESQIVSHTVRLE